MSTHTPTIHEFSTGIYIEWLAGNRWRSKGFTGGWNNNTFGNKYGQVGIPAALDAAIRNKQFEVRAAEQEAAVVGRVVQRQGDPEIWAVVAVVSNAVDNRARGLPVWRYFCCVCTDLTNANLELIRLLGRLDAFNATYGGLPAFDPQTLSGNQSNLAQILPANRPTSEPKSAEYQDALNATNTVILPLVLDAGTCHSYYQLLSLASNIASVQNRFISWAWNVAEVEQPGAFVAIQMAAGFALRMRQAAAPVAAIAAGSDVAALAAVLQEFGRNQQVKEETVQKLDDLLRQDPGLKDPEILRQTYRQFGIEANKKDLKIFQLEQLVNPQQIRALTLWPVLDPQMLPEYQRWCGLFPQSTKQGQIPLVFERELKVLLPQFRNLEAVVGENVVWISWELFQKGKISGAELARQLTDTNSLFAPASDVVCQTLGKRLMQVEQECQQVRQRQVLAQNSELDQQNYFWSDVKSYLQEWSGKDDRQLAASGIYHPLFVTQGPVGQGGVNSSSQGWESWFNIVEGLLKAISVFRSLMNVQQILNRLPSPNHCSQKYSELLTFLDVLCRKPQYKPYFHDLNQFLKFALQPASISASESDRWLKAIGYVIKPIVGVFTLSMVVIVTYLTLVAPVFQALGKAWQGFVANFGSSTSSSGGGTSDPWSAFSVLFWGIVLFILAIVIIALVTSPSIQAKVSELFKGVNRAKWLVEKELAKKLDNIFSTRPQETHRTPWWESLPSGFGEMMIIITAIITIFSLLFLVSIFNPSEKNPDETDPIINDNHLIFEQLISELKPITLNSSDENLAKVIANQEQLPSIENTLLDLSSETSPESLFEWVQTFQRNSGFEEPTGLLTLDDPLYRVLKRRVYRDVMRDSFSYRGSISLLLYDLPPDYNNRLQENDNLSQVAIVQEYLRALKFYEDDIPTTGFFGIDTKAAVEKFQTDSQISSVDGKVTIETWNKIREESLKKTAFGILELLKTVNNSCPDSEGNKAFLDKVTTEIDPRSLDAPQWQEILWNTVNGRPIETRQQQWAAISFETALVRYKYPSAYTDSTEPLDPIPTLISPYDNEALYDLELGVRQQLKCWKGVENSPFAPR